MDNHEKTFEDMVKEVPTLSMDVYSLLLALYDDYRGVEDFDMFCARVFAEIEYVVNDDLGHFMRRNKKKTGEKTHEGLYGNRSCKK